MAELKLELQGLEQTIVKLRHQPRIIKSVAGSALIDASREAYEEIIKNASRTDYTLDDLAKRDHPFAKRHMSPASGLGSEWARKPWMIHTGRSRTRGISDTGKVRNSIKYKFKDTRSGPITIFFYDYAARHVKYVVRGTKIMHPRDVIMGTLRLNESKIKRKIRKQFASAWSRGRGVLRTLESTSRRGGIARYPK